MAKTGRPNLYEERVVPRLSEIGEWAKMNASNREIAEALKVGYSTFSAYVNKYPELKQVLDEGRLSGVIEVKKALYKICVGFEYEETKKSVRKDNDGETKIFTEITTKYEKPNSNAIGMYLRNYDPEFRDKDTLTNEFKKMELDLRKTIVEQNNF